MIGFLSEAGAPLCPQISSHPLPTFQAFGRKNHRLQTKRTKAEVLADGVVASSAGVLEEVPAHHARTEELGSIPEIWGRCAERHGDLLAINDPHQSPPAKYTFKELHAHMQRFASGLQAVGLESGGKVSLFSENSSRWLIADQGIMMLGAADAVRGSSGSASEMSYIIRHSGSCGIIVQEATTLDHLLPQLGDNVSNTNGSSAVDALQDQLKFIVILWGSASDRSRQELRCPIFTFNDILGKGIAPFRQPVIRKDSLATLVYTSGTTGSPKGVELSHGNILYQLANLQSYIKVSAGSRVLSLLPPWHIYERTCSYYLMSSAGQQVYTSIRRFKDDLTHHSPDHFVCVPLVLESLHTKIMQQLRKASGIKRHLPFFLLAISTAFVRARRIVNGVALKFATRPRPLLTLFQAYLTTILLFPLHRLGQILVYKKICRALGIRQNVVSGGGSLATHLDDFYEVIGLDVLNGWGLSESRGGSNVRGSIGVPIPGTTLKVVDPETLEELPDGQQGLLLAKGPGVMRGYLNDPSSTESAMRAGNGFFDTGDLGWKAPDGISGSNMAGIFVLTGRSKDTITMSNGENIEPQPIEDACCASPYISHMLVVGQDKRMLGALIAPSSENFEELEKVRGPMTLTEKEDVIVSEIAKLTSSLHLREKISKIVLLPKPLNREDGTLTQTLKPRRQTVFAKYKSELDEMMHKLR